MASTTDYMAWLGSNEPEDAEEWYCLWEAANGREIGHYEVSGDDDKRFIKSSSSGETLALVSPKAIAAFKQHLEAHHKPDLGWEGAYAFERGMQKDD
ncbi:hypothetical protein ACIQW5_29255 [Methylorubrum thiocyanatum]|uniref:hypothetical protein n=1 Tax=Methylorubrum thiocyanatum TaxID=47958 RepID=UPI00383B05C9